MLLFWFALAFFKVAIAWACAFVFIYAGYRLITAAVRNVGFLGQLAGLMGTYLPLDRNERVTMRRALKAGLAKD